MLLPGVDTLVEIKKYFMNLALRTYRRLGERQLAKGKPNDVFEKIPLFSFSSTFSPVKSS